MIDLFESRRRVLEDSYQDLIAREPVGEGRWLVDAAASAGLPDALARLRAEKFTVAVCGQMNQGKSTLLNALIFGDSVLPRAATTMTAKVTVIRAGDERVVAKLYSVQQFDRVFRSAQADPGAKEELMRAREAARAAGEDESELLTSEGRMIERDSYAGLAEFAAIPDKGGVLAPYVESIEVFGSSEWLREIVVADTPGTNDPNPERDRLTKDWIDNADAVIYVTYAGQAGFDENDALFVDKFLSHIPPSKIIIAVNKCDVQPSASLVIEHFRSLRDSGSTREREMFADEERLVPVSALAGLLKAMRSRGVELGPDDLEREEILRRSGWLEDDRDGLSALKRLVETRIVKQKGQAILEAHEKRLCSVYDGAISAVEAEVEDLRADLQVVMANRHERQVELQRVRAELDEHQGIVERTVGAFRKKSDAVARAAHGGLVEIADEAAEAVRERIGAVQSIRAIAGDAVWILSSELRRCVPKFEDLLASKCDQIEDELNQLARTAGRVGPDGDLRSDEPGAVLNLTVSEMFSSIRSDASGIGGGEFREIVNNATYFFQRWFNTGGGRSEAVAELKPVLGKKIQEIVTPRFEAALADFTKETSAALLQIQARAEQRLKRSERLLVELESEHGSQEARQEGLRAKIASLEEEIDRLRSLRETHVPTLTRLTSS